MKVLWFSPTPANNKDAFSTLGGGSWIEALQDVFVAKNEIELHIAFVISKKQSEGVKVIRGVTYHPIEINRNYIQRRYIDNYTGKFINEIKISRSLEIINECNPDLIHIFGSEWFPGTLVNQVNIPMVIHMQGCWPPYRYANGIGIVAYLKELVYKWYNPHHMLRFSLNMHASKEQAEQEENILRANRYYMCRTRWDRAMVYLYNPNAKSYQCEEALRTSFVNCRKRWKFENHSKVRFISVGGGVEIKGYILTLHAAKLIKENSGVDFEWILAGPTIESMKRLETLAGIKCKDVKVLPIGRRTSKQLLNDLLDSDVYIHTAYIDNSPNAVCEAQYLGLPIITTNVGGIPSLFDERYPSEFIVPLGDPYYLASKILQLLDDRKTLENMSELNWAFSHKRHDINHIYNQVVNIYNDILNDKL